ncbi:MAG: putative minor capsid protein [Huintestinicola sp.]|uniref:putative minor capsid protein n=1 Tax=Huintestinicola sp. TaxID=2981661 RepID=UPI003EFE25FF
MHIPYRLLDGSCILRTYGGGDIFGTREVISEIPLRRVRIEIYRQKNSGRNGEAVFSRGRIFYDCGRSMPEDAAFSAGFCSVIIRGEEFRVTEIKYHYLGGRLRFIVLGLGSG